MHTPRKHLRSPTMSVFKKTYFKIKIANTNNEKILTQIIISLHYAVPSLPENQF